MEEYKRTTPLFSLCGLNCGLCPRYRTQGDSQCPGCGGPDFRLKHPTCAVITCSRKHGNVEYCFQCSAYPCERYSRKGDHDSFISYRNVITDFNKAKSLGTDQYIAELQEKIEILEYLLGTFNDGRRKAFYCNAVNLLPLSDLREIKEQIQETYGGNGKSIGNTANSPVGRYPSQSDGPQKEQIEEIVRLFEARAADLNLSLKLRK